MKPNPDMSLISVILPDPWLLKCSSMSCLVAATNPVSRQLSKHMQMQMQMGKKKLMQNPSANACKSPVCDNSTARWRAQIGRNHACRMTTSTVIPCFFFSIFLTHGGVSSGLTTPSIPDSQDNARRSPGQGEKQHRNSGLGAGGCHTIAGKIPKIETSVGHLSHDALIQQSAILSNK